MNWTGKAYGAMLIYWKYYSFGIKVNPVLSPTLAKQIVMIRSFLVSTCVWGYRKTSSQRIVARKCKRTRLTYPMRRPWKYPNNEALLEETNETEKNVRMTFVDILNWFILDIINIVKEMYIKILLVLETSNLFIK